VEIAADEPVGGFVLLGRGVEQLAALTIPADSTVAWEFWLRQMPESDGWQTTVAMFNPFALKVDIWAAPYDAEGNPLLADQYLWYNVPYGLAARSNVAGLSKDLFPDLPAETAYLHIMSEGPIFGFGFCADEAGERFDTLPLHWSGP
jgi:hypothetical protein